MMITSKTRILFCSLLAWLFCFNAQATRFVELKVVDKDVLMVHFKDGEVIYREDISRPDAYLGHQNDLVWARNPEMSHFNDTLMVYGKRLDTSLSADVRGWRIVSADDKTFGSITPSHAWRKSKIFGVTNEEDGKGFNSEQDHWIFLELPRPMKQGCTYTVEFPQGIGSDATSAEICFDIWNAQSEAVHVNILGYSPKEKEMGADLYLWMGDGGARDYCSFEGKKVYLYNLFTGEKQSAGTVKFWKSASEARNESDGDNMTGSDVWSIDFRGNKPGRYRLVVDGVGCSMDFDIDDEVYYEPYRTALRGYYYMRVGEPISPNVYPIPRQPRFIPEEDPAGFTVYLTDLDPWDEDWMGHGDTWDEPHFQSYATSIFWQHRLKGNPVNVNAKGGHSDAFDWDRHLAHVSNIYDYLLPYFLTDGRLQEDALGILESGNGIPDILDEVRNEVDMFLSLRDPDGGYSQGLTNPSEEWTVMFQAGSTPIAAWANAANAAMMADAFRIHGNDSLMTCYARQAVEAYRYAEGLEDPWLDEVQFIGESMRGRDFKQMAAAFLYNVTGDRAWEDAMAAESMVKSPTSLISYQGNWFARDDDQPGYCQFWATMAYVLSPRPRHYEELYRNMLSSIQHQADVNHLEQLSKRPSRRSTGEGGAITSQSVQTVMLAHRLAPTPARKAELEKALYLEAGWGLGRNPSNTVEMTGLGQRHFTDVYSTGRNDGAPGTHPGQTSFSGIGVWSENDGGDARILLNRLYPSWETGGWPRQEFFFNQRYMWSNGEFTPRQTMRGKFALLAYLYGIRK